MDITPLWIDGPAIVDLVELSDERGFFARSFCRDEFVAAGLEPAVAQSNMSFNHVAGTLRGLHFQTIDAPEAKLMRCTRGAILDVIVDMRPGSVTLGQHIAVELSAENRRALFIPPLFAHGYQTLQDSTEVHYHVSEPYTPNTERGLRYDDPILGIPWAMTPTAMSDKDRSWPLLGTTEAIAELAASSGAST